MKQSPPWPDGVPANMVAKYYKINFYPQEHTMKLTRRSAIRAAIASAIGIALNPLKFEQPVTRISGRQGALCWRSGWGKLIIDGTSEQTIFTGDVELEGEVEIFGDVYFAQNLTLGPTGTVTLDHPTLIFLDSIHHTTT